VLPETPPGTAFVGDLHLLDFFARVAEAADTGLLLDVAHVAMYQHVTGRSPLDGLDGFRWSASSRSTSPAAPSATSKASASSMTPTVPRCCRGPGLRGSAVGLVDAGFVNITFVQRFGSALQLNVHFHVLVPDGACDDDGVFVADEAPDDNDVHKLLLRAGRKVIAVLQRSFNEHDDDSRRREVDRLLASLDAASATPSPALFPAPIGGRRCRRSSTASRCTQRPG
jgi:hypothetical protein